MNEAEINWRALGNILTRDRDMYAKFAAEHPDWPGMTAKSEAFAEALESMATLESQPLPGLAAHTAATCGAITGASK